MTKQDFIRPFIIGVTTFGLTGAVNAEEQGDLSFASSQQFDVSNTFQFNSPSSVTGSSEQTSEYAATNDDIRLTQIIGTQSFFGQLLSEKQF